VPPGDPVKIAKRSCVSSKDARDPLPEESDETVSASRQRLIASIYQLKTSAKNKIINKAPLEKALGGFEKFNNNERKKKWNHIEDEASPRIFFI